VFRSMSVADLKHLAASQPRSLAVSRRCFLALLFSR
jgi:hypothetical protein